MTRPCECGLVLRPRRLLLSKCNRRTGHHAQKLARSPTGGPGSHPPIASLASWQPETEIQGMQLDALDQASDQPKRFGARLGICECRVQLGRFLPVELGQG